MQSATSLEITCAIAILMSANSCGVGRYGFLVRCSGAGLFGGADSLGVGSALRSEDFASRLTGSSSPPRIWEGSAEAFGDAQRSASAGALRSEDFASGLTGVSSSPPRFGEGFGEALRSASAGALRSEDFASRLTGVSSSPPRFGEGPGGWRALRSASAALRPKPSRRGGAPWQGMVFQWVQVPPGKFSRFPAGSNPSGGGGNEAVGALGGKGHEVTPRESGP